MKPAADLLVHHARVWTDGARHPSADAVVVGGGRVLAVGRLAELETMAGATTRRLDAEGATVTPGLTDAHIHLVQWALARGEIRLQGLASRSAVADAVAEFARRHPGAGPVVGRGWADLGWSEVPERGVLDRAAPDRPVLLHSKDFHALWVNGAALTAAGVDRDTPDPPDGRLERDATGEPTGVVREHAVRLFAHLMPAPGPDTLLEAARAAAGELLAEGVTAVHDFEGARELPVLRRLAEGEGPRLRVLAHLAHDGLDAALALGLTSGTGDLRFRIGGVKLFADGTLGSRTAAMLEPYDGTTDLGMELIAAAELEMLVSKAHRGGLSVAIHAIGDRAVRHALDAFAASERAGTARRPTLPSRIEHVQLLDPADLGRFASLHVAASLQPSHCISDLDLVERWWKSRRERSYPWRSLLEAGARLSFGSDAPVEPPSIGLGLHAAVTRTRADGRPAGGFAPDERLTLDQALSAYTEGPARLAGTWPSLGRLAPGAEADLVVWSEDLHALEPARLAGVGPAATVIAGEILFQRAVTRSAATSEGPP
jgi:hypothetical protein